MFKKIIAYFFICLFLVHPLKAGDDFCGIRNFAFNSGEEINYNLYYSVIGLYINAGSAKFTVTQEKINEVPAYHAVCLGSSNSRYDWIFKVRDRYESFIDANELIPIKFIRNVNEGGYQIYNHVLFNNAENKATSTNGTFKVPKCVQDVLSSIYYARNIDFSNMKADMYGPLNNNLYGWLLLFTDESYAPEFSFDKNKWNIQ